LISGVATTLWVYYFSYLRSSLSSLGGFYCPCSLLLLLKSSGAQYTTKLFAVMLEIDQ